MGQTVSKDVLKAIELYVAKKLKYDKATKQFEAYKKEFEAAMSAYFCNSLSSGRKNIVVNLEDGKIVTITRSAKTTIEWAAEKLKKRVSKEVYKQCIMKHYEITDMQGLIRYLKTCGVDPKIFKQFISVDEKVDTDAIDKANELGLLETHDIRGCYTVHCSKPYYTVRVKENGV